MTLAFIRVRLLSFGPLKSIFPAEGRWLNIREGESVAGLCKRLQDDGTLPESALKSAAIAINQEYVGPAHILRSGDEVAILPPVSGGTVDSPLVAIIQEPIDTAAIMQAIKSGQDGAVCVFDGIVRNNTRGRQTLYLDYEAYDAMALRQMQVLRTEAIEHHGVREIAIVHRLGRLHIGETSVFIAVASAHRGAAFDACRWVIDTLKKTVPIWKKEQFADGAVWADGEPFPEALSGKSQ